VRALANLGENERREVVAAAQRAARQSKPHVVVSSRSIRAAIGVVHGEPADALADTDELYDGLGRSRRQRYRCFALRR
jgi:hypothetical protein